MNNAIGRLLVGFRRFREMYFLDGSKYQKLSQGQTPKTLFIGCCDSRVDPAILTDASPGELFVIRNVASLVPPYESSEVGYHGTSSAIEFAVQNLKVENIIILGHRQCGGIHALMHPQGSTGFISHWMDIAREVRDKVLNENPQADNDILCRIAEMESVKVSIKNLRSFPFVRDAIESRQLNIVGIYFDLEDGKLWELNENTGKFEELEV